MSTSVRTLFTLMLFSMAASSILHSQQSQQLDDEIKSACVVLVAKVSKTSLAQGEDGIVTSAIELSDCQLLGSRFSEHIKRSPNQPWQGIIDEINSDHISVNILSMGFEDEANFPVELNKRYLFFLSIGSAGGLANQNTFIPAVPWSPSLKRVVLASKELQVSELQGGKVTVRAPEIDPFEDKAGKPVQNAK